jgi:hypothetical protein
MSNYHFRTSGSFFLSKWKLQIRNVSRHTTTRTNNTAHNIVRLAYIMLINWNRFMQWRFFLIAWKSRNKGTIKPEKFVSSSKLIFTRSALFCGSTQRRVLNLYRCVKTRKSATSSTSRWKPEITVMSSHLAPKSHNSQHANAKNRALLT